MADHSSGWLSQIPIMDADPPIDEALLSLGEVRKIVARLRGEKAASACNSNVELLKFDAVFKGKGDS